MHIKTMTLQLGGVDLASLRENEIKDQIVEQCIERGYTVDELGEMDVYINIEGTAVTAYYICETCQGAIVLNFKYE